MLAPSVLVCASVVAVTSIVVVTVLPSAVDDVSTSLFVDGSFVKVVGKESVT